MSCNPCKERIKIGSGFCVNNVDDETPKECTDPCNRPTEPTTNCPNGGTPRFENWDWVSRGTFVSPRCGETGHLEICGSHLEKYPVGSRITIIGVGSYLVEAHDYSTGHLIIRNTGNAPNGVSFPSLGDLKVISGNHDGHWNDAQCEDYHVFDSGNILLTDVNPSRDDCCAEPQCRCNGKLLQGEGFLESYPADGDRMAYRWRSDVMDSSMCNNTLPQTDSLLNVYGDNADGSGCGAKLTPNGANLYLKSNASGELEFAPLDVCPVPDADEFNAETDSVVFCRDGQTLKSPIGEWIRDNTAPPLCQLPEREPSGDARYVYCENGQAYLSQGGPGRRIAYWVFERENIPLSSITYHRLSSNITPVPSSCLGLKLMINFPPGVLFEHVHFNISFYETEDKNSPRVLKKLPVTTNSVIITEVVGGAVVEVCGSINYSAADFWVTGEVIAF